MTETPKVTRVEVYRGEDALWHWRGRAGDARIVEERGGYKHRIEASAAAASRFPDAWTEHLPEGEAGGD